MKSYLHIILFIILNFTAEYEGRVHVVYKSEGDKAHLTLKEHRNITVVKWRKNHDLIATVENKNLDTRNPEKYHIHSSDSSLFIHNLMVNDSGDYKAQTGQWEKLVIQYKLIVQEAVSIPVIDAKLDHPSNSLFVCDILVKCSADGDSVTYDCDHLHCTRINATSTSVNITVNYTDNGVLECTASNRVSTKRSSIHTINTCFETPPAPTTWHKYILVSIIIVLLVFGVLMICIIKLFYNTKKTKQARTPQNYIGVRVEKDDTHTVYLKLGQKHKP